MEVSRDAWLKEVEAAPNPEIAYPIPNQAENVVRERWRPMHFAKIYAMHWCASADAGQNCFLVSASQDGIAFAGNSPEGSV